MKVFANTSILKTIVSSVLITLVSISFLLISILQPIKIKTNEFQNNFIVSEQKIVDDRIVGFDSLEIFNGFWNTFLFVNVALIVIIMVIIFFQKNKLKSNV